MTEFWEPMGELVPDLEGREAELLEEADRLERIAEDPFEVERVFNPADFGLLCEHRLCGR